MKKNCLTLIVALFCAPLPVSMVVAKELPFFSGGGWPTTQGDRHKACALRLNLVGDACGVDRRRLSHSSADAAAYLAALDRSPLRASGWIDAGVHYNFGGLPTEALTDSGRPKAQIGASGIRMDGLNAPELNAPAISLDYSKGNRRSAGKLELSNPRGSGESFSRTMLCRENAVSLGASCR